MREVFAGDACAARRSAWEEVRRTLDDLVDYVVNARLSGEIDLGEPSANTSYSSDAASPW